MKLFLNYKIKDVIWIEPNLKMKIQSFHKSTRMFVYLSVTKNLPNNWTDIVFLLGEDSYMSREILTILEEGTSTFTKKDTNKSSNFFF